MRQNTNTMTDLQLQQIKSRLDLLSIQQTETNRLLSVLVDIKLAESTIRLDADSLFLPLTRKGGKK